MSNQIVDHQGKPGGDADYLVAPAVMIPVRPLLESLLTRSLDAAQESFHEAYD
jgi:hypothetical protein